MCEERAKKKAYFKKKRELFSLCQTLFRSHVESYFSPSSFSLSLPLPTSSFFSFYNSRAALFYKFADSGFSQKPSPPAIGTEKYEGSKGLERERERERCLYLNGLSEDHPGCEILPTACLACLLYLIYFSYFSISSSSSYLHSFSLLLFYHSGPCSFSGTGFLRFVFFHQFLCVWVCVCVCLSPSRFWACVMCFVCCVVLCCSMFSSSFVLLPHFGRPFYLASYCWGENECQNTPSEKDPNSGLGWECSIPYCASGEEREKKRR